jgi:hypothetical protein
MVSTWWLPIKLSLQFPDTLLSSLGEGDSDSDDGGWLEVLRTIQDRRSSR